MRCEPGVGREIPARNEPGRDLRQIGLGRSKRRFVAVDLRKNDVQSTDLLAPSYLSVDADVVLTHGADTRLTLPIAAQGKHATGKSPSCWVSPASAEPRNEGQLSVGAHSVMHPGPVGT